MTGFKIINSKGFHITFKNKITVSVQFGSLNYCENYPHNEVPEISLNESWSRENKIFAERGTKDAEVAIMDKSGNFITQKYLKSIGEKSDDVIGFQTPAQVLEIMNWAKEQ